MNLRLPGHRITDPSPRGHTAIKWCNSDTDRTRAPRVEPIIVRHTTSLRTEPWPAISVEHSAF